MPRTAEVTVALCTDRVTAGKHDELDRFATAVRTAQQLRDACRDEVKCTRLTENKRTDDAALKALEQGCFAAGTPVLEGDVTSVSVVACDDRAEECLYAARLIRRLLRDEGGYCRDFTVVSREDNEYGELMESALRREGIPCTRDRRESVQTQPLITLVESALSAVTNGWNSDDVLRIPKTGLVGFSATSASLLENYAFVWNIRGKRWRTEFSEHPNGMAAEFDEKATARLWYLNLLRRRLVGPLETLSHALSGTCTGRQFAEAVYKLLKTWHVSRLVRLHTARLDANREHALANQGAQLWDYLMHLLDTFAVGLAQTELPAARFAELFRLAVAGGDLGSIPQGLDGVVVGSADRIRYTKPHTVILLGANEGVFPAYPSSGGIFTDYDRQMLTEAGLPIADNADQQTAEERFYAYAAVAAPSKRLVVTYHKKDGKEQAFPSSLVGEIKRLLPDLKEQQPSKQDCESEEDAFSVFAAHCRDNTAESASYRTVFESNPAYAARLQAMDRLEQGFAFRDPAVARGLFGEMMYISPSRAEEFYKCRFQYFCDYGLHLRERKAATVDSANAGTMTHDLLYSTLPVYCKEDIKTITRSRVAADAAAFVSAYADKNFGDKEHRTPRMEHQLKQLTSHCEQFAWRVVTELQQSGFVPVDYELSFGKRDEDNQLPAWRVTLPNGKAMYIDGKIDRVDIYKTEKATYLRITDYKTSKTFDIANVMAGLDVQLMMYLFALCENGKARYGDNLTPAAALYLPSKTVPLKLRGTEPPEVIEREKLRTMCATGLVLNEPAVISAMEADVEGVFIPVSRDKNGDILSNHLVSLEEFGRLRGHIEALLGNMVELLHRGDVAAVPQVGHWTPCTYCAYRDVCGHENNDPTQTIAALSLAEAMADLKEADDDAGN